MLAEFKMDSAASLRIEKVCIVQGLGFRGLGFRVLAGENACVTGVALLVLFAEIPGVR